jgi:hypothetical protein
LPALSTNARHYAFKRRPIAVEVRPVTSNLAPYLPADGLLELIDRRPRTNQVTEVGGIFLRKARPQMSIGMEPEAITGVTKVLGNRRN